MNGIIRWYNQNRKSIWATIGIIILIIVILRLINQFYKINHEQELENASNQIENTINSYQYNQVEIEDERSSLTGERISKDQEDEIGIIDNFY